VFLGMRACSTWCKVDAAMLQLPVLHQHVLFTSMPDLPYLPTALRTFQPHSYILTALLYRITAQPCILTALPFLPH
jgi:hypothetical protein